MKKLEDMTIEELKEFTRLVVNTYVENAYGKTNKKENKKRKGLSVV